MRGTKGANPFIGSCLVCSGYGETHSPLGTLQVRPVAQEVREEAVELLHGGPHHSVRWGLYTPLPTNPCG